MRIVIPGEPRGKQRPRFSRRTGATYTPSETVQYEKAVKALAWAAGKPAEGPVSLSVCAMYAIPKSASKAQRAAMRDGEILPQKKPDIDNVVKIIMDALNGAAYKDDKQVVSVFASKFYDDDPKVIVEVEQV